MHFGEPLDEQRLVSLLKPGGGIDTLITADVYGEGAADALLGRALRGVPRGDYCLVGAVGHDFYEGRRDGPKGFPRFTDGRLRGEDRYGEYLRMSAERSLERCGVDRFDVLLLHNPDRTGYSSEAVWEGMRAIRDEGLADALGVAPGPANGFTLDLILCLERFAELIDWAMIILGPMEPWPGEFVLPAAAAAGARGDHPRGRLRRPVPRRRSPRAPLRGPRPPRLPPPGLGRGGPAQARADAPLRRPSRSHDAAAGVPVEPRPAGRTVRGADVDPGERGGRPPCRGQARRVGRRGPAAGAPRRGGAGCDPRDRRQRRLHDAEGRQRRPRGGRAARPVGPAAIS